MGETRRPAKTPALKGRSGNFVFGRKGPACPKIRAGRSQRRTLLRRTG